MKVILFWSYKSANDLECKSFASINNCKISNRLLINIFLNGTELFDHNGNLGFIKYHHGRLSKSITTTMRV